MRGLACCVLCDLEQTTLNVNGLTFLSPKRQIPPLPTGAYRPSYQEVESLSPLLESGLALRLALTTKCSKSVTGTPKPRLEEKWQLLLPHS